MFITKLVGRPIWYQFGPTLCEGTRY